MMKNFYKKPFKLYLLLVPIIFIMYYGVSYAINSIATGYKSDNTQAITIDAHGVCQKVTNSAGVGVFVPTKSATEWSAFRGNKPTGVTFESCSKVFPGSISSTNNCSICALEDRNLNASVPIIYCQYSSCRYLLNNDQASINKRCQELGYNTGAANSTYTYAEWCYYANAGTKRWNGSTWVFSDCTPGNVKSATCFY